MIRLVISRIDGNAPIIDAEYSPDCRRDMQIFSAWIAAACEQGWLIAVTQGPKPMVTRSSVLANYSACDGIITSEGKFQGEPIFAPYLYDLVMQDAENVSYDDEQSDTHGGEVYDIDEPGIGNLVEFPELRNCTLATVWLTGDGTKFCVVTLEGIDG